MTEKTAAERAGLCTRPPRHRSKGSATRRCSREGATAIEFAFAAPVLLLVVFGAFELARMSLIRNMAQDAAYEACRFCMVEGATAAEAVARAEEVIAMVGAKDVTVVINDGQPFNSASSQIRVNLSIPMESNALLLRYFFTGQYINAQIELNVERYSGFYDGGG